MCHLPRCLHALPEAEVHDGENEKEAEHQLPANSPDVSQPRRLVDLQNVPPVTMKKKKRTLINHHVSPWTLIAFYICVEYHCKAIYICGFCNSHLHALTCKIPLPETWRNSSR